MIAEYAHQERRTVRRFVLFVSIVACSFTSFLFLLFGLTTVNGVWVLSWPVLPGLGLLIVTNLLSFNMAKGNPRDPSSLKRGEYYKKLGSISFLDGFRFLVFLEDSSGDISTYVFNFDPPEKFFMAGHKCVPINRER